MPNNKIAFNPQDRFLVSSGDKLMVLTQNGDVFGHEIDFRSTTPGASDFRRDILAPFKFTGKAAFNGAEDRFVVTAGETLFVLTQNGNVFGHNVFGRDVGAPFPFTGSKVAFNGPEDRFVVFMNAMLVVLTQNGDVFGHDLEFSGSMEGSRRDIKPPFKFAGSTAALNGAETRFVVSLGSKLMVVTRSGEVFGHEVSERHLGDRFLFSGARMGFNPQDRFVTTIGNTLVVTTENGDAFGADVVHHHIHDPVRMN